VKVLKFKDVREIVLVGHSYGRRVITGVGARAANHLAHMVYLDAFVPADGYAVVHYIAPDTRQRIAARVLEAALAGTYVLCTGDTTG